VKLECKECNLTFKTEEAMKAHISMLHEKRKKPKKKVPSLEPGQLNKKGERIGTNGKPIVFSDGKSTTWIKWVKKMRQEKPEFKVGDKLSPKEARALFKHDLKTQKKIRGAKLEVMEIKEMKNGMTKFRLENKKMSLAWVEGPAFKKKGKLRGRNYITTPTMTMK